MSPRVMAMFSRVSQRVRVAIATFGAVLLALPSGLAWSSTAESRPSDRTASTTTINLTVQGCDGCVVQPVQNKKSDISYWGPKVMVRAGHIAFRVPTKRTQYMGFLVYADFDEYGQGGIPMLVVTGFKGKKAGAKVAPGYVGAHRIASGCWTGTTKKRMNNTLVVVKREQRGQTIAAGWLHRTLKSRPYWQTVAGGAYHVSDPSICK